MNGFLGIFSFGIIEKRTILIDGFGINGKNE